MIGVVNGSLARVPTKLPPQVGYGVLEAIELAAQYVEFATPKRHKAGTRSTLFNLEDGLPVVAIVALIRRVV